MRPADLPDSTRETVDCDTPARRATSTLVTLDSERAMTRYNHVDGRRRRGGHPRQRPRPAAAAPARCRGAARRARVRARGVPAVLGRAVAELARTGPRDRRPRAEGSADARARLRPRFAEYRRRAGGRPRARHRLVERGDP